MMRLLQRLWRWLDRPLFGTKVSPPPHARVDPALFPEEEFPVYCPKCTYLLRGLPDGPCPECGTPFERGRLLVLRYVYFRNTPRRSNKVCNRLRWAAYAIWALGSGGPLILLYFLESLSPAARLSVMRTAEPFVIAGMLCSALALVVICVCEIWRRPGRTELAKRKQVLNAISAEPAAHESGNTPPPGQ